MKIRTSLFLTSDQQFQNRQKLNRFIGWTMFYVLLFVVFGLVINGRVHNVSTKIIPNGQISLVASKIKYTVGDSVQVQITNGLNSALVYNNHCPQEPLSVYRFENNGWSRIHSTIDNSACAGLQKNVSIAPGASYSINYAPWSQLFSQPGIYRIAALADNYNGLAYADIDVVAPASKPVAPSTQIIYKTVYTPIYIQVQTPTTTSSTPTNSTTAPTTTTGSTSTGGTTQHKDN